MLYGKPADVVSIEEKARLARLQPYIQTDPTGFSAEAVAIRWIEKYRYFARQESLARHPDHSGARGVNINDGIDTTKLDAAVWDRYEEVFAELGNDTEGNPDIAKRNFINQFRERIFDMAYGSVRRAREKTSVEFVQPFHELPNSVQFYVVKELTQQAYDFARNMKMRGCNMDYAKMARNSPVLYCDPRYLNEYYRHLVGTSQEKIHTINNSFFNAPRKTGQDAQAHKIERKGASNHPLSGRVGETSVQIRPQLRLINGGRKADGAHRHLPNPHHEHDTAPHPRIIAVPPLQPR